VTDIVGSLFVAYGMTLMFAVALVVVLVAAVRR
jgi:hypothetical protein